MIQVDSLIAVFRNILGWPYVSPGTNDSRGIDCSGAFVYAYRKLGKSIYHGSNRIIREYCWGVKPVTTTAGLKKGMAIFKAKENTNGMSSIYKPRGSYYNAALPHDYYHIGIVASVSPLQIINATKPYARIDSDLSKWHAVGYLNAVDYTGGEEGDGGNDLPSPATALVHAPSGGTVNLRKRPDKASIVMVRVPIGKKVNVLKIENDTWWQITYQKYTGYMMSEFLEAEK